MARRKSRKEAANNKKQAQKRELQTNNRKARGGMSRTQHERFLKEDSQRL